MEFLLELIIDYFFYYIGRFSWIFLKKLKIVSNEFGDWGYVALGFVVFILLVLVIIFSVGALYGND